MLSSRRRRRSSSLLREVIWKKKLLPFGYCPKVAWTPPPRFGHLWGNFRLSRLRKKHTTKSYPKTTLKIPKNYLKTTPKLWDWVHPPPLLLKMSKRKPKKNYPKTFGFGFAPPPPFGQCPKGSSFFLRIASLRQGCLVNSVVID